MFFESETENEINRRLKILFLTARFPYPTIGGDRLKPFNCLRKLSQDHDTTLVGFYQGAQIPRCYVNAVENLGCRVFAVPLNPIKAGMRAAARMFGTIPLETLYYTQPEFSEIVEKLTAEEDFDLGFSFFMRTAEYLKNKPFKKILMAEDCRTVYQYRSYKESDNIKQKTVRAWEYNKLKKYEPEIMNYFDATTLVTDFDIASMRALNPSARLRLLTNGVDIDRCSPPPANEKRAGVMFAGKLDVWANQLAAQKVLNKIFPAIQNQVPDAELKIVGANPPHWLENAVKNSKNVRLFANVPEMIPYLRESQVFLHPHSGGSGIQNKLLEAMACGLPVVTTPTGIQGINAKPGESVLIAENFEEMAASAVRILTEPDFAQTLSESERNLIVENYSWEKIFSDLDAIIEEVMEI